MIIGDNKKTKIPPFQRTFPRLNPNAANVPKIEATTITIRPTLKLRAVAETQTWLEE
jgi:hypothetical protein